MNTILVSPVGELWELRLEPARAVVRYRCGTDAQAAAYGIAQAIARGGGEAVVKILGERGDLVALQVHGPGATRPTYH